MKWGQRLLIVLGVLLPVPLAAATGLTIPLPATVERLAAKLVPFADPASVSGAQSFAPSSRGRIVETEDEVTLTNLLTANTNAQTTQAAQKVNEILARKPKLRGAAKSRNGRVKSRNERIEKERDNAHSRRPIHARPVHKAQEPKSRPPKPPKEPRAATPKPPREPRAATPKPPREPRAATPKPPRELRAATPKPPRELRAATPKPPNETKNA